MYKQILNLIFKIRFYFAKEHFITERAESKKDSTLITFYKIINNETYITKQITRQNTALTFYV